MPLKIERFGRFHTDLGECPLWDGEKLWLMDCRKGLIVTLDSQGEASLQAQVPAPAGSFALRQGGGLVVALRDEVILIDPDGSRHVAGRLEVHHPNMRLNDGAAMPDGSFILGTMHTLREPGEAPLGGLYRLGTDHRFTRIGPALGVANGPLVHPASGLFTICDSTARRADSYEFLPDGTLGPAQLYADFTALNSPPDGCCLDDEGGFWTALVTGSAIVRLDPQGQVTQRIDVPVKHAAALCFGGPDLSEIYLTTISDSGRLKADGPLDGAVLKITGHGRRGVPMDWYQG